ncbi:SusC/RagA family TonB-linked outer membrane protein [Sphingobacterium sp. LRF_L2]|uniref:SusC/RagA family TonB-linked outer membrane protein n=1 Tax=Sphingobacterium sp. LRF_L2 TaxID=3369421 RepID=UPI003F617469
MKMKTNQKQPKSKLLSLLIGLLFFSLCLPAFAQQRLTLTEAIKRVEQRFNANLSYEHNLLQGKFTDSEALKGAKLEEVLKKLLYPNQLVFLYVDEKSYSIVKRSEQEESSGSFRRMDVDTRDQNVTDRVSGTVRSSSGKPIPFASVWVKDTRKGAKSDENGRFLVYDIKPDDVIVVTAVGYEESSVVSGNRNEVTFVMKEKENLLEEVVISTGYQKISKERATGSASVITAKDLEKIPSPNLIQRLEGQVPGVQVSIGTGDRTFTYNNNQLGIYSSTRTIGQNDYSMNVRGIGSIDTETEKSPLVVVDGAISTIDLAMLNPNDVENITILKDAAAASIYGVRAANGVIVVTTKKGSITGVPRVNFSMNTAFSGRPNLGYLKTMNSAEMIDYQEELVSKNILNANNNSALNYTYSQYYAGDVVAAAINLKNGQMTQADYDAFVNPLKNIDNRSQIQEYLLRPMNSQQYNFSISNGTENNNYFYSASYANENPYTKGENGKRLTLNLNNSWKLFKIATLSTSIKGTFFRNNKGGIGLSTIYDASSSTLLPYQLLADENGNGISYDRLTPGFVDALGSAYKDWGYNYLQELALADNMQKDNNYSAIINLEVPFYKGLKGSVMYANERSFGDNRRFQDENSYANRSLLNLFTPIGATSNSIGLNKGGIYNIINTTVNNYTVRGQLSYDRLFAQKHEVTAIAGSEIRQTEAGQGNNTLYGYNPQTGFNTAVSYANYAYSTLAGYSSSLSGSPSQADRTRRFLSYFSNAAYTYLGKYTVSGSVRYDDYNNFGLDREFRATPLWSTGLKWNVSKEGFMKNVKGLNQLALRATYGVNGNITQDVRPFTYITLDESYLNATNEPSASIIAIANPQLRWEKTYVTNIGLDFGLLDNRLTGVIDYYYKDGRDLLYSFPIAAPYVGNINSGTLKRNTATMVGKGVDIGLTGVLLRNTDWNWDMTANFSYNTNEVTDNRFDPTDISTFTYSYTPVGISFLEGYPSDKVFAFRHAGLDENGLTQIYNKNDEVVSVRQTLAGVEDLKYVGRTTAPYYGSLRTNLRYKQWSMYALFTYQFGNVFMKPSVESYMTPSRGFTLPKYDLSADIADRWRESGDEAKTNVPAVTADIYSQYSLQRYMYSDINVLKGDYIRLREVSLSYSLPKNLLNSIKIEQVHLTGSVRNLGLIWTANKEGYDPDFVTSVGNVTNLRPVPSYNFSINVNF